MAGFKLLTKLEPERCLHAAWRAAQDLGFGLTPLDEKATRFTAKKGHVLLSMLGGPFTPNCHFEISAQAYADATEVVLEKNSPWLTTGALGMNRVHRQAEELLGAIRQA